MIKIRNLFFLLILINMFTNAWADEQTNNCDPYEPFNRAVFRFNDCMDTWVLKPIATFYIKVIPRPLQTGISNFFNNIDTVPTIFNDLLQANFYQAVSDTWRLGINTTIGIGGLFDVATHIGLEPNCEDLGLTFAQWGYRCSNYLVIPFWGPSTFRDAIGMPLDYYLFTVYPYIHPLRDQYALYGLGVINRRANLLHFQSVLQTASLDDYAFVRNAYLQHRKYQIERNHQLNNPYLEKNKNCCNQNSDS